MGLTRFTKLNGDFIKNLPSAMKAELIIFEGFIPDGIMTSLCVNDSFYNDERRDFLNHRPDLLKKIYQARGKREKLVEEDNSGLSPVSVRINIETDEEVQFIKDYPQYKQLIESIIFRDDDLNVVKVVPIDQYLAEN